MFTSPTRWGCRWGASRRSTRLCSRSASWMMTWVYSLRSRLSSSISSSCAAPRMPPSGFLISCARLRISSLLASACSRRRSSPVLAGLLLQRPQLYQHLAHALGSGHVHMHRHRVLRGPPQAGLKPQCGKVLHLGPGERCLQQRRVGKEGGEISAFKRGDATGPACSPAPALANCTAPSARSTAISVDGGPENENG